MERQVGYLLDQNLQDVANCELCMIAVAKVDKADADGSVVWLLPEFFERIDDHR